jgi:hypothetical protein
VTETAAFVPLMRTHDTLLPVDPSIPPTSLIPPRASAIRSFAMYTLRTTPPRQLVAAIGSNRRGAEIDLTALIEEWAVGFLRPAEALSAAVPRLLSAGENWQLRARATVTPPLVRLLRQVAEAPGVVGAIEVSDCDFLVVNGELRPDATCLLLGLAAALALEAGVGREAKRLAAEAERRAAERSAREQSDANARPKLAPLPPRP